jgi:hypothetical protein
MLQRRARGFRSRVRYLHDTVTARHASTTKSDVTTVRIRMASAGCRARVDVKASCILYTRSPVSATLIQAIVRMRTLRTSYLSMCSACFLLQSLIRGYIGRMQLTRSRAACIHVQSCWRGAAVRSSRAQSDTSVALLQASVRGCRARSDVNTKRKTFIRFTAPLYCFKHNLGVYLIKDAFDR